MFWLTLQRRPSIGFLVIMNCETGRFTVGSSSGSLRAPSALFLDEIAAALVGIPANHIRWEEFSLR